MTAKEHDTTETTGQRYSTVQLLVKWLLLRPRDVLVPLTPEQIAARLRSLAWRLVAADPRCPDAHRGWDRTGDANEDASPLTLRHHGVARLCECDRLTGEVIRASKVTAVRYERERPGELVHMDVKKLGTSPGRRGLAGPWPTCCQPKRSREPKIGYDYVHSVVDDHTRLAYSEIHEDEKADTTTEFFARAIVFFATHGVAIERVMTDNAFNYRHSHRLRAC